MRHQIKFVLLLTNFSLGAAFALPAMRDGPPAYDKALRRHVAINQPVQISMSSASLSSDNSDGMMLSDSAGAKRAVVATALATTTGATLLLNHQVISQAAISLLLAYEGSLLKHPLRTKVMTGATLAAFGDYLAQVKEMRSSNKEYSVPRALSFAAFDSVYRMFQHLMLPMLVLLGKGHFTQNLLSSIPLVTSNLAFAAALERTLMYQFGVIPFFYYPIFFTFTGLMQGLTLKETYSRAKKNFLPCWKKNLLFWIPTQMVMFGLIQENWQVPFVCVMGIIWSMILSVVAGRATK